MLNLSPRQATGRHGSAKHAFCSPRDVCALTLLAVVFAPFPATAEGAGEETLALHAQTTYIWQKKPSFNAAYTGQNSLIPDPEISYTFTGTLSLGGRPWKGGEIYFNPEATQGIPFSNLAGMGGFTNGEVTRVAGTNPIFYRQRLFLRQTWNMGGGSEKVEPEFNQLAGTVDKNRFVLTVGNFSTLDVFDDNTYAKDPRTQFMNWGNMTHSSFDYAADARGYGWGFAAEWYTGDWTYRIGRMTGPASPNQLPIDQAIGKHYGDQFEVEHAHTLGGQPGRLRFLAWRNRAVLASYRDAIAYGNAAGWTCAPDCQYITNVRQGEKVKYGFGVNAEQAISDHLGVFFRGMWADGRTETLAFTEVDASVAAGTSLKGAAWGRSQDTLGVALLRNMLSKDRRDYLAAGGISFFIGDGRLNYRPETIAEAYYSWNAMKHVWLTADVQRIWNPAYNADRGPAQVLAARFHAEY